MFGFILELPRCLNLPLPGINQQDKNTQLLCKDFVDYKHDWISHFHLMAHLLQNAYTLAKDSNCFHLSNKPSNYDRGEERY